jgi:hypothetical protein
MTEKIKIQRSRFTSVKAGLFIKGEKVKGKKEI